MYIQINNFFCLNQNNYGLPLDCSLTSITAVLFHKFGRKSKYTVRDIYNQVEKIASEKYFYEGTKRGTWSCFIPSIYSASAQNLFQQQSKMRTCIGKGLGYCFETIKKEIDKGNPIILNISKDKGNKYNNHTITIIGYDEENQDLIINNNWETKAVKYKYSNIPFISSICILK